MSQATLAMLLQLNNAGISNDDATALRRCAMTLHRWHELECGDGNDYCSWNIERDEKTGKPFMRRQWVGKSGLWFNKLHPIPDREKGALTRICKIMARYPNWAAYVQTDPRGAPLYIYRPEALRGRSIDSCYNSIGIAVHK